jgi:hypothetical protein
MQINANNIVIPAQAGTQRLRLPEGFSGAGAQLSLAHIWVPACAGMTNIFCKEV